MKAQLQTHLKAQQLADQKPDQKPDQHSDPPSNPNQPSRPQIASGTTGRVPMSQAANISQAAMTEAMPGSNKAGLTPQTGLTPQKGMIQKWIIRNPEGLIAGDNIEQNAWRVATGETIQEIAVSVPDYAPCGKSYSLALRSPAANEGDENWTGCFDVNWTGCFDVNWTGCFDVVRRTGSAADR